MEPYRDSIELIQGTLDMMVLSTLQRGPQHGHGIGQAIRANSLEALRVEHGSLYPALHRLEKQGWIESEWKLTENKQRAKYYRLTRSGRKQLVAAESKWRHMVETVARVLKPAAAE